MRIFAGLEVLLESFFDDPEELLTEAIRLVSKNINLGACEITRIPTTIADFENIFTGNGCEIGAQKYTLVDTGSVCSIHGQSVAEKKILITAISDQQVLFESSLCDLTTKLQLLEEMLVARGLSLFDEALANMGDPYDWLVKPNEELLVVILVAILLHEHGDELIAEFLAIPLEMADTLISMQLNNAQQQILVIQKQGEAAISYALSDLMAGISNIEAQLNGLNKSLNVLSQQARQQFAMEVDAAKNIIENGPYQYLTNLVLDTVNGIQTDAAYWENVLRNKLDFGDVQVELIVNGQNLKELVITKIDGSINRINFSSYINTLRGFEEDLQSFGYTLQADADKALVKIQNANVKQLLTDHVAFMNNVLTQINGRIKVDKTALENYLKRGITIDVNQVQLLNGLVEIRQYVNGQWDVVESYELASFVDAMVKLEDEIHSLGLSLLPNLEDYAVLPDVSLMTLVKDPTAALVAILENYSKQLEQLTKQQVVSLINNAVALAGYVVTVGDAYYDEALGRTVRMVTLVNDAQQTVQYELSNFQSAGIYLE